MTISILLDLRCPYDNGAVDHKTSESSHQDTYLKSPIAGWHFFPLTIIEHKFYQLINKKQDFDIRY